jgi:uncharacterized protein HemX
MANGSSDGRSLWYKVGVGVLSTLLGSALLTAGGAWAQFIRMDRTLEERTMQIADLQERVRDLEAEMNQSKHLAGLIDKATVKIDGIVTQLAGLSTSNTLLLAKVTQLEERRRDR